MATIPSSHPGDVPSRKPWRTFCFLSTAAFALLLLNARTWLPYGGFELVPKQTESKNSKNEKNEKKARAQSAGPSFAGPSSDLQQTIIVPTLESPMPPGKSVIWCATLPMAWQELEKVIGM